MPYKDKIVGVYSISAPCGSSYVGSSVNVKRRWAEHRSRLRKGKHESEKLQAAFDECGGELVWSVIETCSPQELKSREQAFIDALGGSLNTTRTVDNVWANPEVRRKLGRVHASPEWKKARSEIAKRVAKKRSVAVDCSDGRTFESMAEAARAFGTTKSHVAHCLRWQQAGRLGVRLKRARDNWLPQMTLADRVSATRRKNGTKNPDSWYEAVRRSAKNRKPTELAHARALESSRRGVIGVHVATGGQQRFPSIRGAARTVRPDGYRTAACQIVKVCRGQKKTAYGYIWTYAEASDVAAE